ncbi:threonine/serine exporter family protein [Aspergillus glaucus CBS 516.65]|uniref:Threonine/serine exporter-like N-terminal domain-containing protein n=1 Tax=Aspergillus glaucus CBS 516.65 TaxID=1160497 RepID=A0A1L9V7M5_ASPGL|nr:hypothetical protein ASPGLDRAFT_52180 [Aspergillus glaucus CBS 516.65]OJJ79937.1 hypothetical protein ASPGLDRAFT_52180 [Aspergillus glaucus CBS 516.65]
MSQDTPPTPPTPPDHPDFQDLRLSSDHRDHDHDQFLSPTPTLNRVNSIELGLQDDREGLAHDHNERPQPPEEPPSQPHRGLRVRFRSFSHSSRDRVVSDRSDTSSRPLLPAHDHSRDLTEISFAERETGDVEQGRKGQQDQLSPSSIISNPFESNEGITDRTGSTKERFLAAGQLLRQKTTRLTERLGRPPDEGEALGASLLPDDLEGGLIMEDLPNEKNPIEEEKTDDESPLPAPSAEAHRLVRTMTQAQARRRKPRPAYIRSGQSTPEGSLRPGSWYGSSRNVGGILGQLLRLQATQTNSSGTSRESLVTDTESDSEISSGAATPGTSTPGAGTVTPSAVFPGAATPGTATPKKEKLKWYKKPQHQSTGSLVEASMNLSKPTLPLNDASFAPKPKKGKKRKTRLEDEIRVTVHIAEIIARQRYIIQLCRALMRYGAPTHRLEEYMKMTARVLSVEGQFLYLPGCMIMSFDDPATRTAEVKLVRMVQGVDLGRLADTHNVYKNVVHDLIGVEEATQELDEIMQRKPRFNKWMLVFIYGLASAAVGPFAFGARPVDMPISFFLGSLVGFMQHVLSPKSVLYSNVFEVTAAVLTSFLARAFGSIRVNGEPLFCFSALAQSSIALILPGFLVLCSSLELQSHQIIAGSIRMVYAIIYSLFLGYGITVGITVYGLMDSGATSQQKCTNQDVYGNEYLQHFPFVPIFAAFLAIINQAKWKQMPVMILIALCGYISNYFSTKKLGSNSEVANTVGAFTIGVLGNLYSRVWHGHAATAILPGIFVLVPSGLASSGSLIAGLKYADQVRENLHTSGDSNISSTQDTSLASLGFGMIQVAIGITVGLFIAALIIYPFGKRRSGLFSF